MCVIYWNWNWIGRGAGAEHSHFVSYAYAYTDYPGKDYTWHAQYKFSNVR